MYLNTQDSKCMEPPFPLYLGCGCPFPLAPKPTISRFTLVTICASCTVCQAVVNVAHRALPQPSKIGAVAIIAVQMRRLELKKARNSGHPIYA